MVSTKRHTDDGVEQPVGKTVRRKGVSSKVTGPADQVAQKVHKYRGQGASCARAVREHSSYQEVSLSMRQEAQHLHAAGELAG